MSVYKEEELQMSKWNLEKLYKSYDSEEFKSDLLKIDEIIKSTNTFKERFLGSEDEAIVLEDYLKNNIDSDNLIYKLYSFVSLQSSTNTTDSESNKHMVYIRTKMTEFTEVNTLFSKWVSNISEIDKVIASSDFLNDHSFTIKEIIMYNSFNLDEKSETLLSKLAQSSSSLWSKMQSVLTSTLEVEYNGEVVTLPSVRNLAYDKDPDVRKKAFEAEIKAYEKIDKSVAFSLNGIKGQVNTLIATRGYDSALDKALINSRMKKETLEVMLEAMNEYLPVFRQYLLRKAKLLGHTGPLPFYDLFAPVGASAKEFTIPEAQAYILKNFGTFSKDLFNLADKAFKNDWIDYLPYKGKVGGAFCANINPIGESRILSNFTGSFSDVITLSHELGHAFHGDCIFSETILNAEYTMPVAETASTFCETIVMKSALKDAEKEEKIYLLESSLQDSTQVIVDIMSRYLFEYSVFEEQKNNFLDENKLKEMMIDAQKKTYGEALDENLLHPYMWINKGHYYSAGLSFYNWPYAFGLLFAKGLYSQYLKEGDSFPDKYNELLRNTGKLSVEEVAAKADIDVTDIGFWRASLDIIKEDIELFIKLTNE